MRPHRRITPRFVLAVAAALLIGLACGLLLALALAIGLFL